AADNATVYTGSLDKTVKVWKVASEGPTKNIPHPREVLTVVFNPQGTLLATGCFDGQLRIYDVAKGTLTRQIAAHTKPNDTSIYGVAWSPDGKQIVTGSIDYSLKLWDANTGALVREFKGYNAKEFEQTVSTLGASTTGLLGSPPGRGPLLASSTLLPNRIP